MQICSLWFLFIRWKEVHLTVTQKGFPDHLLLTVVLLMFSECAHCALCESRYQILELTFHCWTSQKWAGLELSLWWGRGECKNVLFPSFAAHGFSNGNQQHSPGPQWCHLSNYYSSELNYAPIDRKVNLFPKSPISTQEGAYLHCRSWLCVIMFPQQLGS